MIFKALKNNGSPVPRFNTDDDHSFFEVELYVHHDFYEYPPIGVDTIKRTKVGIDNVLDRILEQAGYSVNDEVNAIADAIADDTQSIDNKIDDVLDMTGNAIAGAIAGVIADKELELLKATRQPVNREKLLASIKLQNHRDNYIEYVKPLIDLKWITMTLPDKPTSPNQQYFTTLKGRLILRILELK
jgi:ATP-dependent DNA helicase RecG